MLQHSGVAHRQASSAGRTEGCNVHGVCLATSSGVVRVSGMYFGGPLLFESVEFGGRKIAINCSFEIVFPFAEGHGEETAADLGFFDDGFESESGDA